LEVNGIPITGLLDTDSAGTTGSILATTTLQFATAGDITLTLPSAITVSAGFVVHVKDQNGSATALPITIDTVSAQTIDGGLTIQLTQDFDALTFVSDGANWSLI
jgi:hypothetical protein